MAKATKKEERMSLADKLAALSKKYPKTVIMGNSIEEYDVVISTGSLDLDIKTGIGGIPLSHKAVDPATGFKVSRNGKIIEIWGWESTGKSTLTQTIMGNAQKDGRNVLLLNSENSLSSTYSSRLGLNLDNLIVIQIDDTGGEEAYKKAQELIKTGEIDLVVIDSYNKIRPLKELENAFSGGQMGNFAKLMGEACNDAMKNCTAYGTTTIFVGQVREKIGVMFGSPETTQGGNALRFDAHMRFKTKRSTTKDNSDVNEDDEKISNLHGVDIEKNKMGSPFRKASFDIIYGEGINKYKEISDIGPKYLDNLKTRGTTVTFDDVKYDEEGFWDMLKNNPELYEELRAKILKAGLQKPLPEDKPVTEIEKELVETLADNIDNV